MKTSYQSYNGPSWRERVPAFAGILALLFGIVPLLLLGAAAHGAPAHAKKSARSDSLLAGPAPGPCAGASDGAEYVGGADAYGRPVAPADVPGTARVAMDDETIYARTGGAEVPVEVRGLRAALAAPDACPRALGLNPDSESHVTLP